MNNQHTYPSSPHEVKENVDAEEIEFADEDEFDPQKDSHLPILKPYQWRMFNSNVDYPSMHEQEEEKEEEHELTPAEETFLKAVRDGRLTQVQNAIRDTSFAPTATAASPSSSSSSSSSSFSHTATRSLVNIRSALGETPLLLACKHSRLSIINYFLQRFANGKLDIHSRDSSGSNALRYAAENADRETTSTLIMRGAEVDSQYELSAFAIASQSSSGAQLMHQTMYEAYLQRSVIDNLSDATQTNLIPDLVNIITKYLFGEEV